MLPELQFNHKIFIFYNFMENTYLSTAIMKQIEETNSHGRMIAIHKHNTSNHRNVF